MKKIIILFSVACISLNVIAQPAVRIGNMEIIIRKHDQDTTTQINVFDDPCPPCPSENETRPKPKNTFKKYEKSTGFVGFGFIIPDNGDGYYTTLGGNSLNFEIGSMKRYHLSRCFALGGTLHYSYYNYRFRGVKNDTIFRRNALEVADDLEFKKINKEAFRSHNIAASFFTRYYVVPPKYRKGGLYIDIGVQGDFAPSRHYMFKFDNGGKDYYKNAYAFNPFTASAIARIGVSKNSAFYFRYRLTDAFNSKELPKDLPPITVGIVLL